MTEVKSIGIVEVSKTLISQLLTVIQLIALAEGWISYALGSILASLFTPIALLSLIWYPLDLVCQCIWMGCDFLRYKLWNRTFTWSASSQRWDEHFPKI